LCSPPRETADRIASVTGLAVQPDARLAERLNWDCNQPYEAFLALWDRTTSDRGFAPPPDGESSRQAGPRLQAFLVGLPGTPGPVAVVIHGGITTHLLRNLLHEDALPPQLLAVGIPPCAVTTIDGLAVVMIARLS
jgi:broad specificity phosphatase PhoE